MLYYADDTVLFSQSTRGVNELLKWTETVSCQYGLKLKKASTIALGRPTNFEMTGDV